MYAQNRSGKSWGVWVVRNCWIVPVAIILSKNNLLVFDWEYWLKNLSFSHLLANVMGTVCMDSDHKTPRILKEI